MSKPSPRTVAIVVVLLLVAGTGAVLATDHFSPTSGEVPIVATDGPEIILVGDTDVDLENAWVDDNTIEIDTPDSFAEFQSQGYSRAKVHESDIEGEWTRLESMDVSDTQLRVDPDDKSVVELEGGFQWFEYRDPSVDDGNVDFRYSAQTAVEVTIHDVPQNEVIAAVDGDDTLDVAESDSSGEVDLTLPSSNQDVELISLDGVPEIVDASPQGQQDDPFEILEVDVEHPDFRYGVTAEVTFYHKGEHVRTTTISSNQTVRAYEFDNVTAGSNDWSVDVEDEFDDQDSDQFSYDIEDTIEIRDEEDPADLINHEVTVKFITGPDETVEERTTSDGQLDITGIPIDNRLFAVTDSDDWQNRVVRMPWFGPDTEIYLIHDNSDFVEPVFELEDLSHHFPDENTVLEVRRDLDGEWKTIHSDKFGNIGQVETALLLEQRYELRLTNVDTGMEKDLGSFTPTSDGVFEIQITPDLESEIQRTEIVVSWSPDIERLSAGNETWIEGSVRAMGGNELDSYEITAELEEDGTRTTLWTDSGTNSTGETFSNTLNMTGMHNGSLILTINWETVDGQTGTETKEYRLREDLSHQYSLLSWADRVSNAFSSDSWASVSTMGAIFLTVILTGLVAVHAPASTELLAVISLASLSAFALIDWVSWSLVFAGGVAFVAFAGLIRVR